ncbi:glycosyltransferase family 9 protein [Paraburkholderia sp. MMS20-SJTN17]|uniref:Glycosyltransferase family 9 protein n=2 Tax=Paraburkholderia translucens TaxID=2886945 RepID=A0ABS8KD96_9BURK|nr:glycosyltransferase family 9 protein [Paraburkholderia sp. MMS20-SJTN17]MCC8402688.1 glycosyltransferase family 9 protein [Paraburkholderia sp. MMS20-SJTN17]
MSERSPRTVLVVCTRRIGDVLLVTPLVRSLKAQWPEADIDVLVLRGTEGALEHNPDLRRVIVEAPRAPLRARLVSAARMWRRYDLGCAAVSSDRALIYAWAAGRTRIGLVDAEHVKWFARAMLHRFALDRQLDAHVVSSTLELARLVGVTPRAKVVPPGIGSDPERRARFAAQFDGLLAARQGQPFVVLHPHSMFTYKQWTIGNWVATIRWLRAQGFAVVLSGGPEQTEREYAAQIVAAAGEQVLNLVGMLTLGETAEVIRRAKLFIGPDTSVTHIAAACGTPTIALFGPSDPVRWGPWPSDWPLVATPWARRGSNRQGNVYLLQGMKACVPCRREGCDDHRQSTSDCLTELPASRVIAVATQMLGMPETIPTQIVSFNR